MVGGVRRRPALSRIALDRSPSKHAPVRSRGAGLLAVVPLVLLGCGESESTTSSAGPNTAASTPPSVQTASQRPRHHPPATRHQGRSGSGAACRAPRDVLAGVYHPQRLQVLAPCRAAAGIVRRIRHEPDGDLHIDVALESRYSRLLNAVNRREQAGSLVVEFMPRDGGHLPEPAAGDHVRLTGAWVNDTDHGWNELHPVWSVQLNGGGVRRSGPQYGGSPSYDRSFDAAAGCRDKNGGVCRRYEGIPASPESYGSGSKGGSREGSSLSSSAGGASFCTTHRCIPSFNQGSGTIVQCADREWSHSGRRPGVCSRHGGVKE